MMDDSETDGVAAIVLAAGLSTRMGQAKQLLPWGSKVIVRHVVDTLVEAGVEPTRIRVVVGHQQQAVEEALEGSGTVAVLNAQFADGSMLRSLQRGLESLMQWPLERGGPAGALVALGDQPQIRASVVEQVITAWHLKRAAVLAPSFGHQRGHPLLFARSTWPLVLSAEPVGSPRDVLAMFSDQIAYLEFPDDAVLRDIDTPDDYRREYERRV
jgi:molybdenum cofactor cytidylyltransferase